jgi:hypothetical protein
LIGACNSSYLRDFAGKARCFVVSGQVGFGLMVIPKPLSQSKVAGKSKEQK